MDYHLPLGFLFFLLITFSASSSDNESVKLRIRRYVESYRDEVAFAFGIDNSEVNGPHHRGRRATITADNPFSLARARRKLALGDGPSSSSYKGVGGWRVKEIMRRELGNGISEVQKDVNYFVFKNQTMFVLLQEEVVVLYRLQKGVNEPVEVGRSKVSGAEGVEIVEIGGVLHLLPVVGNTTLTMDSGSPLLRVDFVKKTLNLVQTIRTPRAQAAVFWTGSGEQANTVFLGVAPETTEDGSKVKVDVEIFRWQGGYFDADSKIPAYNPQSLDHFLLRNNHFLAVANFKDDTGNTAVHSEIFKYGHKEGGFVSFQKIRTFGAKDIRYFEFRQEGTESRRLESFIAVANHCIKDENGNENIRVKSLILKFAQHRFIPFKSFHTIGALQFVPVSTGNTFYLVLLEVNRIRVMQYNGWSFVELKELRKITGTYDSQNSIRLRPVPNQSEFSVASTSPSFPSGLMSATFEQKNDYSALSDGLGKWCEAAKRRLFGVDMIQLSSDVKKAPKTDWTEITLQKPLVFQGSLKVDSVKTRALTIRGTQMDSKLASRLDKLNKADIEGRVGKLSDQILRAVRRHNDTEIRGPIVFDKIDYEHPHLATEYLDADYWNGINVRQLVDSLILTNSPANLTSLKVTKGNVIFEKEVDVETLNGIPFSNYATKTPKNGAVFTKMNRIEDEVDMGGSIEVHGGTFAGVDFTNPNLLLANANQTFNGTVKVNNSNVTNITTKFLNGDDVDLHMEDAVPLQGDSEISAPQSWSKITADQIHVEGLISGVNITKLMESGIMTKGDKIKFEDTRKFESLNLSYGITLEDHLVNGKHDLREDFVSAVEGDYAFGELVCEEDGAVEYLHVKKHLGKKLDASKDGDDFGLVLKDATQRIKSKRISGLHLEHDVIASHLFASVNLHEWNATQRIKLRNDFIYRRPKIHGTLSSSYPDITVKRSLPHDGHDVLPILKFANIYENNNKSVLPGTCELIFEELVVAGNTEIRKTINGMIKPSEWILKNTTGPLKIYGEKVINGHVELENDAITNILTNSKGDDILKTLKGDGLLLHGEDQIVEAPTKFLHPLQAKIVECIRVILPSGVELDSLLLQYGNQTVEVSTEFGSFVTVQNSLLFQDVDFKGLLNGRNFTKEVEDTLRTYSDATQVIQGAYELEGGLTVIGDVETDGLVGNVDILDLLKSLILKNSDSPLTLDGVSSLTFSNMLTAPNVTFAYGKMNGIPVSEWGKAWLLCYSDQRVTTPVRFTSHVESHSVSTKNRYVNGFDIVEISKNALRKDDKSVHFKEIIVDDNTPTRIDELRLGPKATINGLNVNEDFVKRKSNKSQVISGKKIFGSSLTVTGNLDTQKLDGINVDPALDFLYAKNSHQFKGHKVHVKGDLDLKYEPKAIHSVNGEEWTNLLEDVWFTNRPATIRNPISFLGPISFVGAARTQEGKNYGGEVVKVNGIDLKRLKENYAGKKKANQVWSGHVTLMDTVSVGNVLQVQEIEGEGKLCGIHLSTFLSRILTNGTNQTLDGWGDDGIQILKANEVTITGNINEISPSDLDSKLLTLHGENVFGEGRIKNYGEEEESPTTNVVGNLNVVREIEWDGRVRQKVVNGVNLAEWEANKAPQVLPPGIKLVIENLSDANDVIVKSGRVDGVNISQILMKSGDQIIPSQRVEFVGEFVEAEKGVRIKGKVNGYDLNTTFSTLVRKSDHSPAYIHGSLHFDAPVTAHHVRTEGLWGGENLAKILTEFDEGRHIPRKLHFRAKDNYEALHAFADHALELAEKRPAWLEAFALTDIQKRTVIRPATTLLRGELRLSNKTLLIKGIPGGHHHGRDDVESFIEVFLEGENNSYGDKESCIPVLNPISLDAELGPNYNGFLAVASAPIPSKVYKGAVFIYRYSEMRGEFEKTQTLEIDYALDLSLHSISISKELFLVVLSNTIVDNVLVYKFHGVAGWSLEHTWTSPSGGRYIDVDPVGDEGMAISISGGKNGTYIYTSIFKGRDLATQRRRRR